MQPSFSANITAPTHLDAENEPDPTPVIKQEPCCPLPALPEISQEAPSAMELIQALSAAFAIGALTGGLLAYAFSKRTIVFEDIE